MKDELLVGNYSYTIVTPRARGGAIRTMDVEQSASNVDAPRAALSGSRFSEVFVDSAAAAGSPSAAAALANSHSLLMVNALASPAECEKLRTLAAPAVPRLLCIGRAPLRLQAVRTCLRGSLHLLHQAHCTRLKPELDPA